MPDLADLVTAVPDFPSPGITFRDITPLIGSPEGLRDAVDQLAAGHRDGGVDVVAAIESRGFIFGAPLAVTLGCGFVPIRKLGKLPRKTIGRQYSLEYGENHLEVHADAIAAGQRVLIVDDVLATGGTARAAAELVDELGGKVVEIAFLIEIAPLNGREPLASYPVRSLISY